VNSVISYLFRTSAAAKHLPTCKEAGEVMGASQDRDNCVSYSGAGIPR
jgi:hypothetical protein